LNELRNLVAVVKSQTELTSTKGRDLIFLSNALESLSEMIIITDLNHIIIYVNAASVDILGYTPEEMIGKKAAGFFEGIPGNQPNLVEQASRDGVNGVWKGDIFNRKKDGTLINVHLALTWLFDENNKTIGTVGVTTDITSRKKMQEELLEANRSLKELDRLKSDFLTSTSHEFRTPLTSITSFVDILLNGDEENETTRREFLTIIKEDAARLSRLVNNVLDITRIESGTIDWNDTAFNLGDEVKKAIRSVDGLTRKKDIPIEFNEDGGPYPILADPDRVRQVAVNLLSNAIAFSPPRSRISVNISPGINNDRREVKVSVIDRGPGITAEWLDKIFDKFVRITDDKNARSEGTGLGLSICREIITHYGGEIRVESTPPGGSTFSFSLPVSPLQ
ncbi:MAG: PAS domain S-box protein, partial [Desulfobacterales bacterium]|nr:PAS domain S-box protein [Desulfobacterales bacterium]